MLIEKIDVIGAEPLERRVAHLPYMLRPAVGPRLAAAGLEAELGRNHNPAALSGDGLANQDLVLEGAVNLRGVEEVHAQLQRAVNSGDGLRLVSTPAIGKAHSHAAKPEGADLQPLPPQFSHLHGKRPPLPPENLADDT